MPKKAFYVSFVGFLMFLVFELNCKEMLVSFLLRYLGDKGVVALGILACYCKHIKCVLAVTIVLI